MRSEQGEATGKRLRNLPRVVRLAHAALPVDALDNGRNKWADWTPWRLMLGLAVLLGGVLALLDPEGQMAWWMRGLGAAATVVALLWFGALAQGYRQIKSAAAAGPEEERLSPTA
ncbi:hypothetical protein [Streptomyces sulphureus]|uniref:hypothetical protein n=1 Tax=Streptomyces sulphureus TaxID=47758 RepID=UPI0003608C3B|nr:hypothetical protein [Streptomyces sulphureus]